MDEHERNPEPDREADRNRDELKRGLEAGEVRLGRRVARLLPLHEGEEPAVCEPGRQLEQDARDLREGVSALRNHRRRGMEGKGMGGEEEGREGAWRGTYHDDERIPVEEPAVQVRDKPNRERTDGGRDIALVAEPRAGEVVRHPSDARDHHEQILVSPKENKGQLASRSPSPMLQAVRTSSLRSYGAWFRMLRKRE